MAYIVTAAEWQKLNEKQEELFREEKEIYSRLKEINDSGISISLEAEHQKLKSRAVDIQAELENIRQKKAITKIVESESSTFDGITVSIGTKVTLDYGDDKETYSILAVFENDFVNKIISCDTPIAQAILGKKKGDIVPFLSGEVKIVDVVEV